MATSGLIAMIRKEIIAEIDKKLLNVVDRERAIVESTPVPYDQDKTTLAKVVANFPMIPSTQEHTAYIQNYLVPRFMNYACAKDQWTIKTLSSAEFQLSELIRSYTSELIRHTKEVATIYPKNMPRDDYALAEDEQVYEPVSAQKSFVRGRYYKGWRKSLYEAESFDSYTGEYQLAQLLDVSPSIVWWHRLHAQDRVFIHYNPKDRYCPDFVALDEDGTHWIIEAKAQHGQDDAIVHAKRNAAESLVQQLSIHEAYLNQHWGYMIAYEQDIERANAFAELKDITNPVTNVVDY